MLTWLIRLLTRFLQSFPRLRHAARPKERASYAGDRRSGSFTAKPGKEAEAVEAFQALVEPTHREEGCILYALHRGVDDPRNFAFVERWASVEAHDAHMASPHIKKILTGVDDLFGDAASIVRYEPLPAGEMTKGSLAAHAAG